MQFRIPNDIVIKAEANLSDVSMAVAVEFYADNRIDHADACRLAQVTPEQFNRELLQRGLGIQISSPRQQQRQQHRTAG
jgi:predicted HTH domain antitoxin